MTFWEMSQAGMLSTIQPILSIIGHHQEVTIFNPLDQILSSSRIVVMAVVIVKVALACCLHKFAERQFMMVLRLVSTNSCSGLFQLLILLQQTIHHPNPGTVLNLAPQAI